MATKERFIRHRIVNCKHLNVRETPSINAKVICTLDADQTCQAVPESWKKVKETNHSTGKVVEVTWLKIRSNDKRYYISNNYAAPIMESALEAVYGTILDVAAKHQGGATTLAQIKAQKRTTCSVSASVFLQQIGCLAPGQTISHTAAVKNNILKVKDTVDKAIKGAGKLKNCKIIRAGVPYSKLPAKYRRAGCVYVQDSNMCCAAGDGWIYSCNESNSSGPSGQYKNGHYYRNKVNCGYPFSSPILYVIVPDAIL